MWKSMLMAGAAKHFGQVARAIASSQASQLAAAIRVKLGKLREVLALTSPSRADRICITTAIKLESATTQSRPIEDAACLQISPHCRAISRRNQTAANKRTHVPESG